VTVAWQDIIAFRTANHVTVTSGERHSISVTRYVTGCMFGAFCKSVLMCSICRNIAHGGKMLITSVF
jgi:hypothetical protein